MAEGDLRWKYNVSGKVESVIVTDSNGVIYCGTGGDVSAANDKIVAINPDGTLKWVFPGPSPWGFYFITGLCLSNDESVIFIVDAGNNVYALYTADGTQKWMYGYPHPGEDEEPGLSGIVVDTDDNIYVGGWSWGYSLYSVDSGGNFRWKIEGDMSNCGLIIGKNNTVVYYVNENNGLREVQLSDGTVNWNHQGYSWGCDGTGIKIADDGTIYYQDCDYFYAINPDGSEKWYFQMVSIYSNPTAVAVGSNGNIWFGTPYSTPSKVFCLKPDGIEKWNYPVPSWIGSGFAGTGLALDSDDVVFVGCHDHKLYAINPDGTLRWTYTAGDEIGSGIAFSPSEDTVYFGSDDGYLYAIESVSCGKVSVGDKVFLLPIGNFFGDIVALKSDVFATSDKAFLASLDEKKDLKLAFKSCTAEVNDKVICLPIEGMKENIVALR